MVTMLYNAFFGGQVGIKKALLPGQKDFSNNYGGTLTDYKFGLTGCCYHFCSR